MVSCAIRVLNPYSLLIIQSYIHIPARTWDRLFKPDNLSSWITLAQSIHMLGSSYLMLDTLILFLSTMHGIESRLVSRSTYTGFADTVLASLPET